MRVHCAVYLAAASFAHIASALPKVSSVNAHLAPFADAHLAGQSDADDIVPHSYLVQLKSGVSLDDHQSSFLDHFDAVNDKVKVGHYYNLHEFAGYSIEVSDHELLTKLRSNNQLESIEHDRYARAADKQDSANWNLNRISQRKLPLGTSYSYPSKAGEGVDAYVVDSGIWYSHIEFGGRATFGADFVNDGSTGGDPYGHGTHVAGTIGGLLFGVAKKVNLVGVRVLNSYGYGSWSQILAGLNWAANRIKTTKKPSVINMSISGPASAAVNNAVNSLIRQGIHVVVAAGNNGDDACAYSPAGALYAFTVGSTGKSDQISSFSNFGKCVDIYAPGEQILAAWTNNDYAAAWDQGTSMAAPHVAGVKALWLSINPKLTLPQLDDILRKTASANAVTGMTVNRNNLLLFSDPSASLLDAIDDDDDDDDDQEELTMEDADYELFNEYSAQEENNKDQEDNDQSEEEDLPGPDQAEYPEEITMIPRMVESEELDSAMNAEDDDAQDIDVESSNDDEESADAVSKYVKLIKTNFKGLERKSALARQIIF
ncbi:hypothetical protein MP228_000815 [Amoeboaphelidium protococcarum]|nr:hypothetical protein MP228_000815 [Amoeboaphelidium protococcarum]